MKKVLTTILAFLGLLALGVTIGVDAAAEPVATFDASTVVNGTTYSTHSNDDWVVTYGGNNASVGSNAKNVANCKLNDYAYVGEPLSFDGSTANTCAVISKNLITNVKEINFSCSSAGNGSYKTTNIYLVSSDSSDSGYVQVGESQTWAESLTFEVNETGSKYYALVFHNESSTNFRIDTVMAVFMPNEILEPDKTYYLVTWDAQNGEDPETENVEENTLVSTPSDPKKEGYIFTGWYKEAECTELWDFENDLVTSETTLYAGWEKDPYNYAIINTETGNISGTYGTGVSHTLMDGESKDFDFVITDVMKSSSRLQFKKDSGYLYNSTSVRGLISSIEIEFDTSEITVYTSDKPLTDSSSLSGGVVLSKDNPVYALEDVEHSYFAIKNESGSVTYINNIKIQYTYEENFAETIGFIISETKASLKAEYDGELNPLDVDLRFGAKISLNAYNEDAVYGVMVVAADEFAGFAAGATDYATAEEFLAANTGVKKMECSEGALLADGYQFAWVITDMEGHYNTSLTAVIYMEYNGVLYLAICTTDSVSSVAEYYVDHSEELGLTAEQTEVMMNIAIVEE